MANPELSKVPSLQRELCHTVAAHALQSARNSAFLISRFVHPHFPPVPFILVIGLNLSFLIQPSGLTGGKISSNCVPTDPFAGSC